MTSVAEISGTVSSDGEIAKVLETIDKSEIDAAKMVLKKGRNADVRSFARQMEDDHKMDLAGLKRIAKSNAFKVEDSDLSRSLSKDAKSSNKEIKKTKTDFDRAYLTEQIQMHQEALNLIDQKLLPIADNRELKAHLSATRDTVNKHLEEAKRLQAKL